MQNKTSDMFEPAVLQGIVESLEPARGLKLYNQVPKTETIYPFAQWTVKSGSVSDLAEYNTPNSKANLVPRQPGGAEAQASLAYMREGDYFTPTLTMLQKDLESGNTNAIVPAEKKVTDQIEYVNGRLDGRIEWSLWQALQGNLSYTGKNTGPIEVDYQFRDSHKATSISPWDGTGVDVMNIISDIRAMKQLIRKDGGADIDFVYLTSATMDLLVSAFTQSASSDHAGLLTDTQLNEFWATGGIRNFMGIQNWEVIDQFYDVRNEDGQTVEVRPYLPHGRILFGNMGQNSPLRYEVGPALDFNAPRGHIGRFVWSWTDNDPSGRQFVIEESGLPILDRPDQFGYLDVASEEWKSAQTW